MKCQWKGCHRKAACSPVVTITAEGHPEGPRGVLVLDKLVCSTHGAEIIKMDLWEDILTESAWDWLKQQLKDTGRAPPDRESCRLELQVNARAAPGVH